MPCTRRPDRGILLGTLPERGHARNTGPRGKTEFALITGQELPDWSDDALWGGQITLRQHRHGHRAGTDAVLLATALPADAQGHAIDAGAASGAVGLMIARRAPALTIDLVEIDPDEAALAAHNIEANALSSRCRVITADLLASEAAREQAGLQKGSADWVVSNPPFLKAGSTRISPDDNRARAHTLPEDGLERWCRALVWLAAPDARLVLIHRADALNDLLHALEGRFGGVALRAIHPREGEAASRLLIMARKGSRAPLTIQPPLFLHTTDGRFTDEARALHRGHV